MSRSLKYLSLGVLVFQTTAIVLTLRYSRTHATKGPRYLSSTAVLLSEVFKVITSICILLYQSGSVSRTLSLLHRDVVQQPRETLKLAVPAVLYVVQNNLLFVALTNLDAATYQITYQLKILTTAIFSVFLLHKHLSLNKWVALVVLMAGVAFVQMPSGEGTSSAGAGGDGSRLMGLLAVLGACLSSGFTGAYFEMILKGSPISLWIRNICLASFSIVLSAAGVFITDGEKVQQNGFFQGYSPIVWGVVILQAYGGLLVALVVKYADVILKGFATSVSIILSTLISAFFLGDLNTTSFFYVGACLVILATFLYGYEPTCTAQKTR